MNKIKTTFSIIVLTVVSQFLYFCNSDDSIIDIEDIGDVTADFNVSDSIINQNDQVYFYENSGGEPTSWEWTFEGGSPGTSNSENPTISYANSGVFKVSLTVANSVSSNTITKDKYIVVLPTSGLIVFYDFNGNAEDVSGNDFHGDANATLTTDRNNNINAAYGFNGIDEYINFPDNPALKPELPVSFSYWVKFDDMTTENSTIFTTDFAQDNHSGVWMAFSSGKIAISYGDNTGNTSSVNRRSKVGNTVLEALRWYHIVAVVKGPEDIELYINGINDGGNYSGTGGSLGYTSNLGSIGRKDAFVGLPAYYFKGNIDEYKYWNRALSENEVDLVFNY